MSVSSERAYAHIKAAILSGRYRSGSRLPEDMVAGELGISRTPIRDALRRLQVEQLITVTPYSGARVASWSERDLDEVAHMRAMLEGYAAALACAKRTPGQIAALEAVCDRMDAEAARTEPNIDRLGAGNLEFHRAVVETADSTRLTACLGPMWSLPVAVRKFGLYSRDRMMRSLSDHREVVRAITLQDSEWANAIMRMHILGGRAYDDALAQHDDALAQDGDGPCDSAST